MQNTETKKENKEKELRRHKRYFSIGCAIVKPLSKLLFNYSYEKIPEIDGPVLILCNHNTDCDCAFLALAAPKQVYFVATENIARMGLLGKLLIYGFNPILHFKGMMGTNTVREILKKTKAGSSVAFFPEGNRSFNGLTNPIPSATGKLAKMSGATLINYTLEGGYLTCPRWGKGIRKGRIRGKIAGIYTPDDLSKMSSEDISNAIKRDLFVDAYEDQKVRPVKYIGKDSALGLESMLFLCPKCNKIGTLKSGKNSVKCSCGYNATYTPFGFLESPDGSTFDLTSLDNSQRKYISELVKGTSELFSDEITFRVVDENHSIISESKEKLSAFSDRFKAGEEEFLYSEMDGLAINQRNLLLVHKKSSDKHYEFEGSISFSALKYLYAARTSFKSASGLL